jgi:hypothetical protein
MCYGAGFVRYLTPTDRAPVLALIGPTRRIKAHAIETDFSRFYRAFLGSGSLIDAIASLGSAEDRMYYTTTAQGYFLEVWAMYKRNQCSSEMIEQRALSLYRRAKAESKQAARSVGYFKRKLIKDDRSLFEKYRNAFFMYDVNPINQSRFAITYDAAQEYFESRSASWSVNSKGA